MKIFREKFQLGPKMGAWNIKNGLREVNRRKPNGVAGFRRFGKMAKKTLPVKHQ